jgi:hypothetical protein
MDTKTVRPCEPRLKKPLADEQSAWLRTTQCDADPLKYHIRFRMCLSRTSSQASTPVTCNKPYSQHHHVSAAERTPPHRHHRNASFTATKDSRAWQMCVAGQRKAATPQHSSSSSSTAAAAAQLSSGCASCWWSNRHQ